MRPACKPPAVAPQGFKLHAERGWYGNLSTMTEIGGKGEMTLNKCAESCRASASCLAFHGYFPGGGGNCSELKGDCYIHSAPLVGPFVGGDSRAILYDRRTVAHLPLVFLPSNKSSIAPPSPSSPSSPSPPQAWDSQMVEYASVWRTSSMLGLFYAGNGYGKGGIGYTESPVLFSRTPLKDDDDDAEAI